MIAIKLNEIERILAKTEREDAFRYQLTKGCLRRMDKIDLRMMTDYCLKLERERQDEPR